MPALEPQHGSITTISFITSGKIIYLLRGNDPIFPAKTPFKRSTGETHFVNTRGHAGVLACIDRTEVRDPTRTTNLTSLCQAKDPTSDDAQSRGGFWLLWRSLLYSSIYQSTNARSADALVAQHLISNRASLPLPAEHWKIEVIQLFRASLARIQVEARDIARGAAANRENYYRFDFGADICNNTYLFKSEGFQNINVVGYLDDFWDLCCYYTSCNTFR
jgi:hypothetical protein